MKKIYIITITLMFSSINVNAAESHEGPFLGINTMKDMCHMITEDESFTYKGGSETKLTMNNNFVLANCKGEFIQENDMPMDEVNGRNQVTPCRIKVQGIAGFFEGTGGFTVDTYEGVVSANCKAIR